MQSFEETYNQKQFVMKYLLSVIALSFALSFTLTSCNEYEEGPNVSLRTAENRLKGDFKLIEVMENGVSVEISDFDKEAVTSYLDDNKYRTGTSDFTFEGEWNIKGDDKNILEVSFGGVLSLNEEFEILRLKGDEHWLRQTNNDGDETVYKFEEIED